MTLKNNSGVLLIFEISTITKMKPNTWTRLNRKYYTPWRITLSDENGDLVIAKGKNAAYDSKIATNRVLRALSEKKVTNTIGKDIDVGCDTVCVHSDTPNAVEIITSIKSALNK